MRRFFLVVMLVAIPSLLFAGGQSEGESEEGMAEEQAGPQTLQVISHRVHNSVTTTGDGGDIVADFVDASGVQNVEWITLGVQEIHQRMFREATLPSTTIDVAFILNNQVSPRITELFMPLDEFLAQNPIENLEDISPGLREAVTFGGQLYGIPFRHATSALHYNSQFFEERGIDGPPETIEEMIEMIPELTYTRDDGTQVYGFLIPGQGQLHANHVDLARAWNGDFITTDYEVAASEYGMVKAIETMKSLYQEGLLPQSFTAIANTDLNTWMQQGRVAMTFSSTGRNRFYNDPEQSSFPGVFETVPIPISEEFADEFDVAPAKTEFWSIMIPRNADNPELAWEFIKFISSQENTIRAALNGNGPVRGSAYEDNRIQEQIPYWDAEQQILQVARVPLPGFENAGQAADLFTQYAQQAIVGNLSAEEAMDRLAREVQPLVP